MKKETYTKREVEAFGFKTIPTISKAIKQGYFSRTLLEKNKIEYDENIDFYVAYSGIRNGFVKVFKSTELLELYNNKTIKF